MSWLDPPVILSPTFASMRRLLYVKSLIRIRTGFEYSWTSTCLEPTAFLWPERFVDWAYTTDAASSVGLTNST